MDKPEKQKIMLDLGDGKQIDLQQVLTEGTIAALQEAGFPLSDGKVDLKSLPGFAKSEADVKMAKMGVAANFLKYLLLPAEKHAAYGVKQITTDNASMGATVPTELADVILEKKERFNILRQRAFSFQLAGPFDLPLEGTGVTAYWVGESDTEDANLVTESEPTVTKKTLNDYYLGALVKVSWKLLDTAAFNIVNYVATLSGRALAQAEEQAFVSGSGTGRPKGIRQESVESIAQAGDGLSYQDVVNLWFKLPAQYRQNAVFLTGNKGAKLITGLKDSQDRPIFTPGMPLDELFRRPLLESADIPENLGTGTDTEVWFGDPAYYWIKDGQSMQMATDPVIERLQTKVLVYQAVDGKLTHTESFVKLTGVNEEAES
jgi:HK97 family phage major capsid protein